MYTFKTTYDASTVESGLPPGPGSWYAVWLLGGIGALLVLAGYLYPEGSAGRYCLIPGFFLTSMFFPGLISLSGETRRIEREKKSRERFASGDFEITEGPVQSYKERWIGHKGSQRTLRTIRVGGLEFYEPDEFSYPLSGLKAGHYVRISHHEGEIMKIEVAAEPGAAPGRGGM